MTHLAAAAAGLSGRARRKWSLQVGPLEATEAARYRFTTHTADDDERSTGGSTLRQRNGSPIAAACEPVGQDRVVAGSIRWFADVDGVYRVRFALPLKPGEHVLGFGERFDRLDQRGHCIDAVVFEQYKGQAAAGRTYLPMPFAHVLGGDRLGFPRPDQSPRLVRRRRERREHPVGGGRSLAGARARNCMSRSTTARPSRYSTRS